MYADAAIRESFAGSEAWVLGLGPTGANRSLRRKTKAKARQVTARREVHAARKTAREVGETIWSASDPADLTDILDAYANDEALAEATRAVEGDLFRCIFPELPDQQSFVRRLNAKAPASSIVPDILEGLRIVSVISRFFREHPPTPPSRSAGSRAPTRPASPDENARVDYRDMPQRLLSWVIAHHRSTAALAALIDLALSDRLEPPTWLVRPVVRAWVEGERTVLALVTMLHGAEGVPKDLLPAEQRFQQDQLSAEQTTTEATFQQFIAEAAAHH
jgi:hypothetical protein